MSKALPFVLKQALVLAALGSLLFVVQIFAAEPTTNPPTCPSGQPGCDAPLNVGPSGQSKQGMLLVNLAGGNTGLSVMSGDAYTSQTAQGLRVKDSDGFCYRIYTNYGAISVVRVDCADGTASTSISAPSAPQNLVAIPNTAYVSLAWNAPVSNGGSSISNYKLYRGTTSGGPYTTVTDVGNALNYLDNTVVIGTQYYYAVSATNATGEGPKSNEVGVQPGLQNAKLIFVSSQTTDGEIIGPGGQGLAGANSICQLLANNRGLGGTFEAWLSNRTVSATSQLYHNPGPYVLVDGTVVANNWADLADGSLRHAINETEDGTVIDAVPPINVWTNTTQDGNIWFPNDPFKTCVGWTSIAYSGGYGYATSTSATWTRSGNLASCSSTQARLYCLQQ